MATMKCPHCSKLMSEAIRCPQCGKRIYNENLSMSARLDADPELRLGLWMMMKQILFILAMIFIAAISTSVIFTQLLL